MNKRKQPWVIVTIIVIICLLGITAWLFSNKKGQTTNEFRIGVILPAQPELV